MEGFGALDKFLRIAVIGRSELFFAERTARRELQITRQLPSFGRAKQLDALKWLRRPWPEAVHRELRLLPWFDVHKHVVVVLLGRLSLPIEIWRVIRWDFNTYPARKDRILFSTPAHSRGRTTAQHDVFHHTSIDNFDPRYPKRITNFFRELPAASVR